MIRFAWLQSRNQTLLATGLLAVLAVAAAVTGCDLAVSQFLAHDTFMDHALDILARAVPALLGIFWGAPLLAREFEAGTHRLAWTQSVSRSRWLVVKLALGALATAAVAGLLTLTITWWYRSRDHAGGTSPYAVFDRRDIVPIAYAVFAFALGALLGGIIRRTVPSMAATLGGFIVARVVMAIWIRPHLIPARHETFSLRNAGPNTPVQLGFESQNGGALHLAAQGQGPPRSWTLSSHVLDKSGHAVSAAQISGFLHQHCPHLGLLRRSPLAGYGVTADPGLQVGRDCIAQVASAFHLVVAYQPASRYWTFQWSEAGVFLLLALGCAAGCYRWVTRRSA